MQQAAKLYHSGVGAPRRSRRGRERDEALRKGVQRSFRCDWGRGRENPFCRGRRLGEAAGVGEVEPRGRGALKRWRPLEYVCLGRSKERLRVHRSVSVSPLFKIERDTVGDT